MAKNNKENLLGRFRNLWNKLPQWLRWILFFPFSLVVSLIVGTFVAAAIEKTELFVFEVTLKVIHSVVVQAFFLVFIFETIPKFRLKTIKVLIALRALLLLLFIFAPLLSFLGIPQKYNMIFFVDFIGEILTLVVSVGLFKELRNELES